MEIIFVYNANSGLINTILDMGHKIISPDTYQCDLCNLTYGIVTERKEWKNFRKSSKDALEFLHKDEFEEKYREKREYPVILSKKNNKELEQLLGPDDLKQMKTAAQLIDCLKKISDLDISVESSIDNIPQSNLNLIKEQ